MKSFTDPKLLASCLLELVEEWKERDSQIYCVATAGEAASREHNSLIEEKVFRQIQDSLADTAFATRLQDGVNQMLKLACEQSAAR